jgi:hypothetical protein
MTTGLAALTEASMGERNLSKKNSFPVFASSAKKPSLTNARIFEPEEVSKGTAEE